MTTMRQTLRPLLFSILSVTFMYSVEGLGYIPPNKMIFKRMIDNAGSGGYIIDQEVLIPVGDDTVQIKETWIVESSQSMKLVATSGADTAHKFRLSAAYRNGEKTVLVDGQNKTSHLNGDFFQGLAFLRSETEIANLLSNFGLKSGDLSRLSRAGGTVSYAIGGISDDARSEASGIWIEQDQFVIRKVKSPSGATWSSDTFANFAKGLVLGNSQTIQWENQVAQVHVRSVKPLKSIAAKSFKLEPIDQVTAPTQVVDFYNRFR